MSNCFIFSLLLTESWKWTEVVFSEKKTGEENRLVLSPMTKMED